MKKKRNKILTEHLIILALDISDFSTDDDLVKERDPIGHAIGVKMHVSDINYIS